MRGHRLPPALSRRLPRAGAAPSLSARLGAPPVSWPEIVRRREQDRAGVVPSELCAGKPAPSFVRVVTALPSCASCVTMLPSAETRRDSQAMSSSRSVRSAAGRPAVCQSSNRRSRSRRASTPAKSSRHGASAPRAPTHPMRAARSEYDAPSVRAADASDSGSQRPARYGQNDREIVLNRKNALFAGHDQEAENWACIATHRNLQTAWRRSANLLHRCAHQARQSVARFASRDRVSWAFKG